MDLDDFIKMVESISCSTDNLVKLISDFTSTIRSDGRYVKGSMFYNCTIVDKASKMIIVGDLHGDYQTLLKIIEKEELLDCLNKDCVLITLGDYVDRGYKQLETITAIYLLKTLYPGNVVVLRGNHEPPYNLIPHPHDFPEELYMRFKDSWHTMYYLFLRSFQKIPYMAIVPGEALLVHGGPPARVLFAETFIDGFSLNTPLPDDEVLEDILWSDPIDQDITYTESYRGAGKLYGEKITKKSLSLTKTKVIIRSHEPAYGGYKINHNGRVVTVFTSRVYGLPHVTYLRIPKGIIPENLADLESFIEFI